MLCVIKYSQINLSCVMSELCKKISRLCLCCVFLRLFSRGLPGWLKLIVAQLPINESLLFFQEYARSQPDNYPYNHHKTIRYSIIFLLSMMAKKRSIAVFLYFPGNIIGYINGFCLNNRKG